MAGQSIACAMGLFDKHFGVFARWPEGKWKRERKSERERERERIWQVIIFLLLESDIYVYRKPNF